jgi:hypothetical protein
MLKWTKTEGEFSHKAVLDSAEFYLRKNQNALGGWILKIKRGGVPSACGYHARLLAEIKQIAEMFAQGPPAVGNDPNPPDSFRPSAGRFKKFLPKRKPKMATKVEVTEYEVEVEDHSPETTRNGQVVINFISNSDADNQTVGEEEDGSLHALIYRTKTIVKSDDMQVVIYTDGLVNTNTERGITFIYLCGDNGIR